MLTGQQALPRAIRRDAGARLDLSNFDARSTPVIERSPIIEFKFVAAEAGEIAGLAAAFNNVDATGDILAPGAFAASLAKHKAEETAPAMLWSHMMGEPIGRWIDFRETARGLEVRGKFSDVPRGRDARTLAKDGALGFSIGFRALDFDHNDAGNRILRTVDLVEVSLVAAPANSRAKITSVKSALANGEELTAHILERTLRDAGCPKKLAANVITRGWRSATDDRREADDGAVKSIVQKLNAATAALRS